MYSDYHLVCVTLRRLSINAGTRHVTDEPVVSAVPLIVVACSIESYEKWAAVGDDTPGLQNGQPSEALAYADESELTAVKGDRLKAVLTLS